MLLHVLVSCWCPCEVHSLGVCTKTVLNRRHVSACTCSCYILEVRFLCHILVFSPAKNFFNSVYFATSCRCPWIFFLSERQHDHELVYVHAPATDECECLLANGHKRSVTHWKLSRRYRNTRSLLCLVLKLKYRNTESLSSLQMCLAHICTSTLACL